MGTLPLVASNAPVSSRTIRKMPGFRFAFAALVAVVAVAALAPPALGLHASCEVSWAFGEPCDAVFDYLADRIANFDEPDVREDNYTLIAYDADALHIHAIHTTPTHGYIDDVIFDGTSQGGACAVAGSSKS